MGYAYSEGIGSAREIERLLEYEPGFQWLGGLDRINRHSLSDFRVNHPAASMKANGIDPAFAPRSFTWDEATNTMLCPANQPSRGEYAALS